MTRAKLRELAQRAFEAGVKAAPKRRRDEQAGKLEWVFEEFYFREFPPKLSRAQVRMLESVASDGDPYLRVRGRAEHGGADGTLRWLQNHKLVSYSTGKWALTDRGAFMLLQVWRA